MKHDGVSWQQLSTGITEDLTAVWGSSATDVYAVGDNGTIIHSADGSTWSIPLASDTTENLTGIWGSSSGDVYAIGRSGVIAHHFDGTQWTGIVLDSADGISELQGTGAADVFAISMFGEVTHFDGVHWAPVRGKASTITGLAVGPRRVVFLAQADTQWVFELIRTRPW
jgi:hypothetical protein